MNSPLSNALRSRPLTASWLALSVALLALPTAAASQEKQSQGREAGPLGFDVRRLADGPLIRPDLEGGIGVNVQGPSLIRVPDWVQDPLGAYYLYFADHKGSYIRLAYADDITGPWTVHEPGSLHLEQSGFPTQPAAIPDEVQEEVALGGWATGPVEGVPTRLDSATKPHIASPDVHVRDDRREIVMYYHGLEDFRFQRTRVATSRDGIRFESRSPLLANSYLRAFRHEGQWYGMAMPGIFYRSVDGIDGFEASENRLFPTTMRHGALLKRGDTLYVFWSRVGDAPEHILVSTIDVSGDWATWSVSDPASVIWPEEAWEGADQPRVPSVRDAINVRVNQLRDPAIFEEDGRTYLLYSAAGESGIGLAELVFH